MSSSVSTLTIYRHFLKALRNYPSVKQPQYIIACREGKRQPDFLAQDLCGSSQPQLDTF